MKKNRTIILNIVFVLIIILLLFLLYFCLKYPDKIFNINSKTSATENYAKQIPSVNDEDDDSGASQTNNSQDDNPPSNEVTDAYNETETMEEQQMPINPDRVTLREGFFYEPLSEEIITRITGVSFKENPNITYDDLRYLNVQYWDFDQKKQTGEIICNKLIAQDLLEIFSELYDNFYQIEKIKLIDDYDGDDDLSCDDNNTSSFNYRVVAGTEHLSKHALGLAIDINPFYNPYITYPNGKERISPVGSEPYGDRDSGLPHMILEDDICYNLFIDHGFTWGGNWKSIKDYQHFQKELE